MDRSLDRRRFLYGLGAAPALPLLGGGFPGGPAAGPSGARTLPAGFPRQDPALVREVVGAAHNDLERVRTLVELRPALARASWDWGFGDWETALGAASHVGRPDIAAYLMGHGARPTLFTFAMLGRVDAVRAAIEAEPGVEAILGPHGITLLAHARAGKEAAASVVEYLESLGTADPRPPEVPLPPDEVPAYSGVYAFGDSPEERAEVGERRGSLTIRVGGEATRVLVHVGGGAFHPSGVPSVRVVFSRAGGRAALAVHDGDAVLEAVRVT
ncbi:MAG: hypothetical protein AMXMBFR53_03100 [Gemmatimonadota bacterium]